MQPTSETDDSIEELAVRRLFIFLKKTLNFDYYQDEFIQRKLLSERELKEFILTIHEYFRSEKFLKLIIKKKRCKEFVACMCELPNHDHDHITEKIRDFIRNGTKKSTEGSKEKTPPFSVSDELLRKNFHVLCNVFEPREIADEMFQAGQISCNDHDYIADNRKKYKRMRNLLDVLKRKQLYSHFVCLLESLNYASLLETLSSDRQPLPLINSSECTVRIQRSFTTLQIELPEAVILMMEHILTESDVSDIQRCSSTIRQISKLIKILISKGQNSCEELSETIESGLKRKDLIQWMIRKSDDIVRRGKPVLKSQLRSLTTACLKKYEDVLYDELEPLFICDVLFEESAVDVPSHDEITEPTCRRKQAEYLLKTVKENKHDCFHFFLYIIQEEVPFVCQELEKHTPTMIEVDGVPNEPIQLKLTTEYDNGAQEDQILYQRIHSFDTGILKDAIIRQTGIESVISIAVTLQLRPLTGSAVPTPLKDKDRQKLMRNVSKMVEEAETCIAKVMNKRNPLQIRIQIQNYSWDSPKSDDTISNEMQIKNRVKVHRNELVSELDPGILLSALRQCTSFPKSFLDALPPIGHCKRVEAILAFVENGNNDVVNEFVKALHDLSYDNIVGLIYPGIAKSKAENIKKRISSNYKEVLDEMQLSLATEALSKCTGDVDGIRKKIRPTNGNRRQRMSEFLHFVLQDDINLIEFERMLRGNNLENIIDTWAEDFDSQELKKLLESFDVVIPSYSIARDLLGDQLLNEWVTEVRALGKSVVHCKTLKDKKPGTVCVYEVLVKNENNNVVIYEKDPENRSAFFNETQRNLVKVILIDGISLDVFETKDKVYQKYKKYIDSGTFCLQHVSEKNVEVAKLSAHKKIIFYEQHIESIRRSFPLSEIEVIVERAASHALTHNNIRDVCRQAYISGIGNVNSGSYTTRSIFTLNRITVELKDKTKESITKHLGDKIRSEIRSRIRLEPESKFRFDLIMKAINLASTVVLASMLIVMISILNPLAGVFAVTATGFITLLFGQDVNSETWRDAIAEEIYKEISNRQSAIEKEISSLLKQKLNVASDDLNAVAKKLEEFRRRIDAIN